LQADEGRLEQLDDLIVHHQWEMFFLEDQMEVDGVSSKD